MEAKAIKSQYRPFVGPTLNGAHGEWQSEVYRCGGLGLNVRLEYGVVCAWGEKDFVVDTHSGKIKAKLATSCLLRPEIGDKVLVCYSDGEKYVLSVLEKGDSSLYAFDLGEVCFNSHKETLRIVARNLEFVAAQKTTFNTLEYETTAIKGRFFFKDFTLLSHKMLARIHRIECLVESFSSWVNKLTQRIRNYYSCIQGIEYKRVGRSRYIVKENIWLKGKRVALKGEEKVKINAKKINLG